MERGGQARRKGSVLVAMTVWLRPSPFARYSAASAAAHNHVAGVAVLGECRDTDRDGDIPEKCASIRHREFGYRRAHFLGALRSDAERGLRHDEEELFAPGSARNVLVTDALFEHAGNGSQHEVACFVTVKIIERLEVVDIDGDNGKRAGIAFRARHLACEGLFHVTPVEEAGDDVTDRLLAKCLAQVDVGDCKRDVPGEDDRELLGALSEPGRLGYRRCLPRQQSNRLVLSNEGDAEGVG